MPEDTNKMLCFCWLRKMWSPKLILRIMIKLCSLLKELKFWDCKYKPK